MENIAILLSPLIIYIPSSLSEHHVAMARILPFVVGQYLIGWGIEAKAAESDRRSGKNTEKEKFVWIQRITNSLFVCISLLMSKVVTPTNNLLLHIKVFLTCCYKFGMFTSKQFFENKANYYCLLNLPEQIKRFGSLRWYWDGNKEHSSKYLGTVWDSIPYILTMFPNILPIGNHKIVQHIKPELKNMQKTQSYLAAKLGTIRKKEAFKFIFDSVIADDDLMSGGGISEKLKEILSEENKDWYKAYYKFPTLEDIKKRLESGKALCGFITTDKPTTVCIPFGTSRSKIEFIEISWHPDGDSLELVGLQYFNMSMSSDLPVTVTTDKKQLIKMTKYNCTMLPYKKRDAESFDNHYTIITDDWSTIRKDGKIGTPELSFNLFGAFIENWQESFNLFAEPS